MRSNLDLPSSLPRLAKGKTEFVAVNVRWPSHKICCRRVTRSLTRKEDSSSTNVGGLERK